MKNIITARVAHIIDNRTLILSTGSLKGVRNNMRFNILSAHKTPIVDPETKEQLGELDSVKLLVKVTEVHEKYSIAETYEYTTINKGGSYNSSILTLNKFFEQPKLERHYKTFEIDQLDRKAIDEKDSFVRIGDRAEQIIAEAE
jgi:hypothetical protein